MGDPVSTPPSKTQHIVVTAITATVCVVLAAAVVTGLVVGIVAGWRWVF